MTYQRTHERPNDLPTNDSKRPPKHLEHRSMGAQGSDPNDALSRLPRSKLGSEVDWACPEPARAARWLAGTSRKGLLEPRPHALVMPPCALQGKCACRRCFCPRPHARPPDHPQSGGDTGADRARSPRSLSASRMTPSLTSRLAPANTVPNHPLSPARAKASAWRPRS